MEIASFFYLLKFFAYSWRPDVFVHIVATYMYKTLLQEVLLLACHQHNFNNVMVSPA